MAANHDVRAVVKPAARGAASWPRRVPERQCLGAARHGALSETGAHVVWPRNLCRLVVERWALWRFEMYIGPYPYRAERPGV